MIDTIFDDQELDYEMRAVKSLYWSDIPGFNELLESCSTIAEDMVDDKDILDEFISRDDENNPTNISAYVSRFRGIVLVYYQDDNNDTIRFINILPNSDHNKKYVIYKLSNLGVPKGMTPNYGSGN